MATPFRKSKKNRRANSSRASGSVVYYNQPAFDVDTRQMPPIKSMPLIVPDRVRVRLRYSENVLLAAVVGVQPAVQTWAGNSIWDPDVTGVGGTVTGASFWANFYARYLVVRSRMNLTCINGVNSAVRACLLPTTSVVAAVTTPVSDAIEQERSKPMFFGQAAGGHDIRTVSTEVPTATVYGVEPEAVESEFNYSGAAVSANPTTLWYWTLVVDSLAGVTLGLNCEAVIDYDVVFSKRLPIT